MGSSVFDSVLLRQLWGTEEIYRIFSDENKVQKWLDFEAALALEQAEMGIIPQSAAREISEACHSGTVDIQAIGAGIRSIKHRLVPVLREVQKQCTKAAGEWIHFGPTTQDVVDTGTVLQLQEAHAIFLRDLCDLGRELYRLGDVHKATPMVGRTHGAHALPISFGHKCVIWLRELARHHQRLKALESRVFVGSLVGAVGTMAALGRDGVEVERRVMAQLGLGQADISWAPARDRFSEYANVLGLIGGTLTKIANEIFILQRDEIGELEEPFTEGKVGSSTMPHKRNPTVIENIVTAGRALRYNVSLMAEAMVQENERDGIAWKTEWKALPESCMLLAAMLNQIKFVISGLVVRPDRMLKNLNVLGGYLMSERIMFVLGEKVGKQTAHEIVYQASMQGRVSGKTLEDALLEDPRVRAVLQREQLREVLDPTTYMGLAPELVERALDVTRREGWLS